MSKQWKHRLYPQLEPEVRQVGDRFKIREQEVIVSKIDRVQDEVIYFVSAIGGNEECK